MANFSTFILLGLGVLVALIGVVLLLIAAFRQSAVWGLVTLFIPCGHLVFVCMHWARAKTGFLTNLAGVLICVGAIFTVPDAKAMLLQKSGLPFAGAATPAPKVDLNAQIQQQRTKLEGLQAAFASYGQDLPGQYQALEKRRKALKPGDEAAIGQFNQEVAAYQARNARHKQIRQEIEGTQRDLDALLDARSRAAVGPRPSGGKQVVMYTTSRCPACTAAKQYMAKKGIPYQEIDVEASRDASAAFQKLGGRGVPLILVGEKRMEGFNSQELDRMLL
jgi:glutaredoxin